MPRSPSVTLALALAAAALLALASCGGEDAKLLPGGTAREITENLDTVKALAEEGECDGAAEAAREVAAQVTGLSGVEPELKRALERGSARLDEVIATCEDATFETVAPAREAAGEEARETPPGRRKKQEREASRPERETERKEGQTTPSSPPEPPPAETTPATPPSSDGGTDAPGGVSPGAPVEPEGE